MAKMSEFIFTWKINNYSSNFQGNMEAIESPVFKIENLCNSEYVLQWFREDLINMWSNMFLVVLQNNVTVSGDVSVELSLEIVDEKGSALKQMNRQYSFSTSSMLFGEFMPTNELHEAMSCWLEDTLIVRCRIKIAKQKIRSNFEAVACTTIGVDKCCAEWDIKIPELYKYSECVELSASNSHVFEVTMSYFKEDVTISIHLKETESVTQKKITVGIIFCDNNGYEIVSKRSTEWCAKTDIWNFPDFITKESLDVCKSDLEHYEFKLKFQIDVPKNTISSNYLENVKFKSSVCLEAASRGKSMSAMANEFRSLYVSKKYSDVLLCVEDEEFSAHKFVLKVRSPVFEAMFDQEMLENQTGVVYISDLDSKTLKAFLEYLYTETVDKMDYESATKLMIAADKYQVRSLVNECAYFLRSILSLENVCEIIALADLVSCESLKDHILNFVKVNAAKLLSTTRWLQCVEENTKLATYILYKLSADLASSKFKRILS